MNIGSTVPNNQNGNAPQKLQCPKEYNVTDNANRGDWETNIFMYEKPTEALSPPERLEITEKTSKNWFQKWLKDEDKVSTDGKDDGKISFKEKMKSFGKGLMCVVKAAVNHPVITAATIAAGVGLTVVTGGAAAPVLVALGVGTGAGLIGYGSYKAATAKTDGEAKQAWENIGQGTFTLGASALSAKSALKSAAKAGVTSAQSSANMNPLQATVQSIKSTPEALKVSGLNAKGNILTWTTGKLHANANILRKDVNTAYSKPVESKAYKFDSNGTTEEVLAKNPYVQYDAATQKYYVDTSWGEKAYLGKDYVVMEYGPNDVNAVSGADFKASYVDKVAFAKDGVRNYMDTANMKPGEWTPVVKQAQVQYKIVPDGTKYVSKEGTATVQKNSLLMIDKDGSPYQNTVKTFIKRNGNLTLDKAAELCEAYPEEFTMRDLIVQGNIKQADMDEFVANCIANNKVSKYYDELGMYNTTRHDRLEHWSAFGVKGDHHYEAHYDFEDTSSYKKLADLLNRCLKSKLSPEEFYDTLSPAEQFAKDYEKGYFIEIVNALKNPEVNANYLKACQEYFRYTWD